MSALGIGVIGAGKHGLRYVRHLTEDVEHATLVAVCRRDAREGRAVAAEHGCDFHADWRVLIDDPRIDASDIEVHLKGGELTLSGSVRTREEKRLTEDLVERVTGVREVNNHLRVRPATEVLGTARIGASVLGLTDTPPPTRNH